MHLIKIEIQGFKSFADKITIEFKKGITSIVGPNGSGKSNISDAIRWVLGEQSVKALRGSRMEDVIFSGTNKRKALGFAEVTITLDNKGGKIPLDYREVAITRRMFRSGESEYYLNKNSCRLKDIREILMDTGVGIDGYSIIGQGKIDEILSTRPEDRRKVFEEAAGIVKYKSKKEAAEKKLEKTKNNLLRISDILSELKKQAENLRMQSEKASDFIELSERLKKLEITLFIRKIDMIKEKMEVSEEQKTRFQKRIEDISDQKYKLEDILSLVGSKIKENDSSLDIIQQQKTGLSSSLNMKRNSLRILKEKEKFHRRDVDRLEAEIKELNVELKELEVKNTSLLREKESIKRQLESLNNELSKSENGLLKANNIIQLREKTIEKKRNQIADFHNRIADKKNQINNIRSFEKSIDKRILQIQTEIHLLMEKEKVKKDLLKELNISKLQRKDDIVEYNGSITSLKLDERKNKESLEVLYNEINQNKIDLQGKITNFNLLKNMEEDYEGYYRSVKNLMLACKKEKALKSRLVGVVADLLKVDPKYEKAIDIALGGSLQNIVTRNEEDTNFIITYLRRNGLGRVTFLPISTIKNRTTHISSKDREKYGILGLGSELVRYNVKYKNIVGYLLGRTIIVENLEYAGLVAKRFNYSFRIVTLEGDMINPGGSITGGSLPKISGNLLNRKDRINSLKKEINKLSLAQRGLEDERVTLESGMKSISDKLVVYEEELQSSSIEVIKLENEMDRYGIDLKEYSDSIKNYEKEIDELCLERDGIKETREILIEEIDILITDNNVMEENIKKIMASFEEEKLMTEKIKSKVTNDQIQASLMENGITNKRDRSREIEGQLKAKSELRKNKKTECTRMRTEIDSIKSKMTSIEDDINKISELAVEKQKNIVVLKDDREALLDKLYKRQRQLKDMNEMLNGLEKEKGNWDIKYTRYSTQLENITEKMLESYGLEYMEALGLLIKIDSLTETNDQVRDLKNKIKGLGSINVNSIEEYKTIVDRLEFMENQYEDLILAKENLQGVIQDMEAKMKKQFLYAFNKIDKSFRQVFTELFDGGKASLVLEDEMNILTCGIGIQAQPLGKKLQNISLLSGGEKSLTAVALLFAIVQTRPAPFCILDEIDAALDEINIGRYTNYLKGLSNQTQFIMITHRKGTMEIADILYGVTMEEEGVSKMVSVKLTDDLSEIAS